MLNTSVTLFNIEQDNLAQPDPNPGNFIPGTEDRASVAVQGAQSTGFEFEVSGEPIENLQLSFSYTQFKAEEANGDDFNTDMPRKLLKLYTSYNFSGAWHALTIGGGINWQDASYYTDENPATEQPEKLQQSAYALVNLMARYEITEQLSAQFNIANLLDETYYTNIVDAYGEPRNVNLTVRYQF